VTPFPSLENRPVEDPFCILEIYVMLFEVELSLVLVPLKKQHVCIVCTYALKIVK
jgi:hypothetical protein